MIHAIAVAGCALLAMLHYEVKHLILATHGAEPTSVVCHVRAVDQHCHAEEMVGVIQPCTIHKPCVECVLRLEMNFEDLTSNPEHNRTPAIVFDRVFGPTAAQEEATVGRGSSSLKSPVRGPSVPNATENGGSDPWSGQFSEEL